MSNTKYPTSPLFELLGENTQNFERQIHIVKIFFDHPNFHYTIDDLFEKTGYNKDLILSDIIDNLHTNGYICCDIDSSNNKGYKLNMNNNFIRNIHRAEFDYAMECAQNES